MTTQAVSGINFRGFNQIIFWEGGTPKPPLIYSLDDNQTFNNCYNLQLNIFSINDFAKSLSRLYFHLYGLIGPYKLYIM